MQYKTADFQRHIFAITEDESIRNAVIVAFRGSAKSTIVSLAYPLWAILGRQEKKFVLICSQTERQSQIFIQSIKKHLESSELFINDFGPLSEDTDEWQKGSLVLNNYDARIMASSVNNSLRGIRHQHNRPDLIIIDDVEDTQSVRSLELRDKTSNWFKGEIIPAGQEGTKIMVVGNYLHHDCLIARLKEAVQDNATDGVYKQYPIYDKNKNIFWKGKYPTFKEIEELERTVNDLVTFYREYLLEILSTDDQVVYPEWIQNYKKLPTQDEVRQVIVSVDPAIGETETNDFTAIITAYVTGYGEETKMYILPDFINKRMSFPATCEAIEKNVYSIKNMKYEVLIEDVAYQRSLSQYLVKRHINAIAVKTNGQDKRARLAATTPYIKAANVLFPTNGAKVLIQQLVGFGTERHDDLADAFSLLVNYLGEDIRKKPAFRSNSIDTKTYPKPLTAGLLNKKI